jgi:HEAT repeat protein
MQRPPTPRRTPAPHPAALAPSALPTWLRSLLLGALLVSAATAHAAESKSRMPSMKELQAELDSGDQARVQQAIERLAARKRPDSAQALIAFVRAGQPDALCDRAIAALGAVGSPEAMPLLAELSRHRRPAARVAALTAAAAIPGEPADALLTAGLRDSDPAVRGQSARLLGERGTRSAAPLLFRALERGVPEAAAAIGRLGDAAAVARMHGLLGKLALQTLLEGYERFLARADLDEASKLDIVTRLGEVAGPAVKRFLEQQLAAGVAARAPRLASALKETAKRIPENTPATREPKP